MLNSCMVINVGTRYIDIEEKKLHNKEAMLNELKEINIVEKLDSSINIDRQKNFHIQSNILKEAKDKWLPTKKIKFNKKKHKKHELITDGIL